MSNYLFGHNTINGYLTIHDNKTVSVTTPLLLMYCYVCI